MGLFGKKNNNQTKCDVCNLELPTPERLERHKRRHTVMFQKKKWMMLLVVAQAKAGCGNTTQC